MSTTKNLIDSLFPKTKKSLLALLFLHPDEKYYIRQIEKLTKISQGALQRELRRLVDARLINREIAGHQIFYSVKRDNPIFDEIYGIMFKTFAIAEVLSGSLKSLRKKIDCAFIYGSIARRDDTAASDIDLFVIGAATFGDLTVVISKEEQKLGREVNIYSLLLTEFKEKIKSKNHFVNTVIESPKIFLFGSENDLRRMAQ